MKILFSGVQPQAYLLATGQTTSYGSGDGVDDGDTYTGTAKLNEIDLHYEINGFGTSSEYSR